MLDIRPGGLFTLLYLANRDYVRYYDKPLVRTVRSAWLRIAEARRGAANNDPSCAEPGTMLNSKRMIKPNLGLDNALHPGQIVQWRRRHFLTYT